MTKKITLEQKKELIQVHLVHEINMLGVALNLIEEEFTPKCEKFKESIIVDLYLTHARNLWMFFYGKHKKDYYAYAQHFMASNVDWNVVRPPISPWIKKISVTVECYLSHLTYKRKKGKNTEWNLNELHQELITVSKVFLTHLDESLGKSELSAFLSIKSSQQKSL